MLLLDSLSGFEKQNAPLARPVAFVFLFCLPCDLWLHVFPVWLVTILIFLFCLAVDLE
jgi:hypothetical protein